MIYDVIVIGSGYLSAGISTSVKNSLIVEETECIDTHFYLPLKGYRYVAYLPITDEGKYLFSIFNELGVFKNGFQNVNGFECALCKYVEDKKLNLLIKSRVVEIHKLRNTYRLTIQNNAGLKTVECKRLIDTTSVRKNGNYTMLFTGSESEAFKVKNAFKGKVLPAFYNNRYALTIPANDMDENDIKVYIYDKWIECGLTSKILYMPPEFSFQSKSDTCDDYYDNPIEAFEHGLTLFKEGV